ncbi:MAG: hypothetical protein ABJB76_01695 [Candidatus Nitrosocosmicus sp.]
MRLKELKQLHNTILEIAKANNISHQEAVSKFLDDIEKEYDDKLGFESKVKEKKYELVLINKELYKNRQNLWFTPLIGSALFNLFQKGVSEQDIIGINHLLEVCTNNNTVFSNSDPNNNNENIHKDNGKDNTTSNRSEYWKLLTDDLKKYGSIKLAIKDKQDNYDKLHKEVNELNKQKQETSVFLQLAIFFINKIYQKISYCKGFLDRYNKDLDNKNSLSSRASILPILIVYENAIKEKDADDSKDKEDDGNK